MEASYRPLDGLKLINFLFLSWFEAIFLNPSNTELLDARGAAASSLYLRFALYYIFAVVAFFTRVNLSMIANLF